MGLPSSLVQHEAHASSWHNEGVRVHPSPIGDSKLIIALAGMVVVLICESLAIFEWELATTSPAFLMGFGVISALASGPCLFID